MGLVIVIVVGCIFAGLVIGIILWAAISEAQIHMGQ